MYVQTQAGVTLFGDILKSVFGVALRSVLPDRVLPISTRVPNDMPIMLADELEEIRRLLKPGRRQRLQARARARTLAVMENSINDMTEQPSDAQLDTLLNRIAGGEEPKGVFPGVAALRLSMEGEGIDFSIRITKSEGLPVKLVKEGMPDAESASVVAVHKVDALSYYSLGRDQLAERLGLSGPKTTALIRSLKLQDDPEYFNEFQIMSQHFARYSPKALDRLGDELPRVDMDEIWAKYGVKKKAQTPRSLIAPPRPSVKSNSAG